MIKGKHVGLRAIEKTDLAILKDWRNQPHFRKYFREYRELNHNDQEQWFQNVCCGNKNFAMFAVTLQSDYRGSVDKNYTKGQILGVCGLTNINWVIRFAELSFYIGLDDLYVDNFFAKDAVDILIDYAFNTLNLNKVWAEIYDFDIQKITLFKQLQMTREARLRQNAFFEGEFRDSFVYSILKEEYLHFRKKMETNE